MGAAMSTGGCVLNSNADIAGVGARTSVYVQNILCFLPAVWAISDGKITDYELDSMETMSTTNLVVAFGILISCFIQASTLGLSNFHASIVLNMSWMNNTNVFIYFLLYAAQLKEKDGGWMKNFKDRMVSNTKSRIRSLFHPHPTAPTATSADTEAGRGAQPNTASSRAVPAAPVTPPAPPLTMRQLLRRVSLVFGSLHLTLMSALGLWLWSGPRTFGTSDSACAVDHAHLAIAGAHVPFGSSALRGFSLFIYGLFLIPGFNLFLPTAVFLGLYVGHGVLYPPTPPNLAAPSAPLKPTAKPPAQGAPASDLAQPSPTREPAAKCVWSVVRRISSPKSPVFPAFLGLLFLLLVNIIFIIDIELTLKGNQHLQDSSEAQWGFGQVLAVLLLFLPLRDLVEMIFRRRQELQTQMDNAFRKAISDRDVKGIGRWADAGANLNTKADDGCTALEAACIAKGWDTVQLLGNKGVNVNTVFKDHSTALEVATRAHNRNGARILVGLGADINIALNAVSRAHDRNGAHILVELGADVNAALGAVSRANDRDGAHILVELGADVNAALEAALSTKDWDSSQILIHWGADINTKWKDGQSALEAATRAADLDSVCALLQLGANVNAEFKDGTQALEVASLARQWDLVTEIVNGGADVNAPFKDYYISALYTACQEEGPQAVIELLLKKGADVNSRGYWNKTSLRAECRNGRDVIVQLLLDHGTDPTLKDRWGNTPLHNACIWGKSKCAEILLKHVKNPADLANVKNNDRWTPLHWAYSRQHQDCIKLLLANGADDTIEDRQGKTPPQQAPAGFRLDP